MAFPITELPARIIEAVWKFTHDIIFTGDVDFTGANIHLPNAPAQITATPADASVTNAKIGEAVSVAKGGTGGTTAADARTNLGVTSTTDLASTANGKGASTIGVEAGTTNVEAALAAVKTTADSAAALAVQKKTCAITQAGDLAGLAGGVKSFVKVIGTALPANALIVGYNIHVAAVFNDGVSCAVALGTGTTTGTFSAKLASGADVKTATGDVQGTAAQGPGFRGVASTQITAEITGDSDLNTLTTGSATVDVFYVVLA